VALVIAMLDLVIARNVPVHYVFSVIQVVVVPLVFQDMVGVLVIALPVLQIAKFAVFPVKETRVVIVMPDFGWILAFVQVLLKTVKWLVVVQCVLNVRTTIIYSHRVPVRVAPLAVNLVMVLFVLPVMISIISVQVPVKPVLWSVLLALWVVPAHLVSRV